MNASTITLEQHQAEIGKLQLQILSLQEQIDWFKKQLFGSRSEKFIHNDGQLLLDLQTPEAPPPLVKKIPARIKTIKGKNSNKIDFPEDLPIERIVIDLKDEEKICPETGKPLVKIGEEVSQKLAHRSGSYYIKEVIRPKYAMPKGAEETILAASLPASIFSRCKADESFLADILVKKFVDHLPFYRQSEILARENIQISRQILSQWAVKCGLVLKPLYEELKNEILNSKNLFVDETPVDMLKPGKGKVHQAYMWVIAGGREANPALRVYNFRTSREHVHAAELLKGCHDAIVHSDKFGAYEALACQKKFIWSPCWAHIRRKFLDGEAGDPDFVRKIIRKIKYLYLFERIAWTCSEEKRLGIRKEKEIPIINEIISLVKDRINTGKVLPRSKFSEALTYFMGLIPYLKNYTNHPFARLDNNVAERAVRPLAIGRKNWLFLGCEEGGEAAAVILSLVQTCKALKINPREYFEDVMRRIQDHNFSNLSELLPHNWSK